MTCAGICIRGNLIRPQHQQGLYRTTRRHLLALLKHQSQQLMHRKDLISSRTPLRGLSLQRVYHLLKSLLGSVSQNRRVT